MNESTRHGHRNGYYVDGCRCDPCKAAAAAYTRDMRAKRKLNVPAHDEGSRHMYANFGCRCDACKLANAAYLAEFRQRPGKQEIAREASRRWALEHPDEFAERVRRIQRRNGPKRKIRMLNGDTRAVSERDWLRLCARHDFRCFYCDEKKKLTMDHIVPISRGGRHSIGNLIPACQSCNSRKRHRLIVEWKAGRKAAA